MQTDESLFDLIQIVDKHVDDKNLICSGLFGSRARGEANHKSDIDIFIITKHIVPYAQRVSLTRALQSFADSRQLSFDDRYPVELVTKHDLQLALDGYGFVADGDTILVEDIGPDDWTQFNSYRQWLAMFATSNRFLSGDVNVFSRFVTQAKRTMLQIALCTQQQRSIENIDSLIELLVGRGKQSYGFVDSINTKAYIRDHYEPLLDSFVEEGLLCKDVCGYGIASRIKLLPVAVKSSEQFKLESNFLGVHDNQRTLSTLLDVVGGYADEFLRQSPLEYLAPEILKSLLADSQSAPEQSPDYLLRYSVRQNHPRYLAFPDAGNAKPALIGAMIEPILNQNMIAVDKSAPIATFIEMDVISRLRSLVGYDVRPTTSALDLGGIATSGGVGSNVTAMLIARSHAFPSIRQLGIGGMDAESYLLITDRTLDHYSHGASFWWLGLGEDHVIQVKSNRYQFDLDDLKEKLEYYNSNNKRVVAIVALAGDSRTLTIQRLAGIHKLAQKFGVWLHLDACHGSVGLFSSHREQICEEFKLADSISLDPHKGLALPYSSSFCLLKDQSALTLISKSTDITIANGSYDLGQVTPFAGSRPFDTIKLWNLLRVNYQETCEAVDYRIDLAKKWAKLIENSKYFIALHSPDLTALAFSVDPAKTGRIDVGKLNKRLHDAVYREGWATIHSFDLVDYNDILGFGGDYKFSFLGVNFGNVQLDQPTLTAILDYLEEMVDELEAADDLERRV